MTKSPTHTLSWSSVPGCSQQPVSVYLHPPLCQHTRIRCFKANRTSQSPSGSSSDLPRKEACWHSPRTPGEKPPAGHSGYRYWRRHPGSSFANPSSLAPCTTIVLQYSWESMGAGCICQGNVTKSQSNWRRDLTADVTLSFVSQCNQNIDDKKS